MAVELDDVKSFPVTVSAVFGRTDLALQALAALGKGSALKLDREADAPVILRVNGMDFAHGELVTVDSRVGVRIIDFL